MSAGPAWWRRPVWVSRQTGTALAAAVVFVASAVLLTVVPAPYVVWSPGITADTLGATASGAPAVEVAGAPTYPTSGQLDLTTVSVSRVDSRVGLVEALAAWARPGHDALDRQLYYPEGLTEAQNEQQNAELMTTAQSEALVAALRQLGQTVGEQAVVSAVLTPGSAQGLLHPGDVVRAVGGRPTPDADAAVGAILTAPESATGLPVTVQRGSDSETVTLPLRPGADPAARLGIVVGTRYLTDVEVDYGIDPAIGGPSAGLVFAVAIYDKLTPGELLAGRHVAGTGTITDDGVVGAIGGIQSKIDGAEAAGAEAFLVPADNCADVAGVDTDLQLIRVATLADAVAALSDPGLAAADVC